MVPSSAMDTGIARAILPDRLRRMKRGWEKGLSDERRRPRTRTMTGRALLLLPILRAVVRQARRGGADLPDAFLLDFAVQASDQLRHRHGPEVAVNTVANGHGTGILLLL